MHHEDNVLIASFKFKFKFLIIIIIIIILLLNIDIDIITNMDQSVAPVSDANKITCKM